MKVLVFVKATANSEQGLGATPPEALNEMFAKMGRYNEELVKAGIMKEGDGLKPSSFGKRIRFSDSGATTVIDGPFAETKELVAGYWVWNVKSMDEAMEWARRCPNPMPGEEGVLEIRPTYGPEDFGEVLTEAHLEGNPNLREQYERREQSKAGARPKSARRAAKKTAKKSAKPAARRASARARTKRAKSKK